ncbi:MAG: ABC transporter ATP-binding protein [Gemmatimonadota bacterium]
MTPAPLVQVEGLAKRFAAARNSRGRPEARLTARDDVSFTVPAGETVALVGESGSGKTTTGRCVLRLLEPDAGRVVVDGHDVRALDARALRALRRRMQLVFQDPATSLNPRLTVGALVGEGLVVHGLARGAALRERVAALLAEVGLESAHAERFPHEFSGGQRQRIGIARALAVDPAFVVCDEPVSALDVSVQAQVLNLLRDLQRARGLAYLFISHDLAVVRHVADRVAVLYAGRLVEVAPALRLFAAPRHPYTTALLSAVPPAAPGAPSRRLPLASHESAPPRAGCVLEPRCPHPARDARCRTAPPPLLPAADGHLVACHHPPLPLPA